VGEKVGEDSGDSTTLTDTMAPLQTLKVAEILEALVGGKPTQINYIKLIVVLSNLLHCMFINFRIK
jgi:hypothetical protein